MNQLSSPEVLITSLPLWLSFPEGIRFSTAEIGLAKCQVCSFSLKLRERFLRTVVDVCTNTGKQQIPYGNDNQSARFHGVRYGKKRGATCR